MEQQSPVQLFFGPRDHHTYQTLFERQCEQQGVAPQALALFTQTVRLILQAPEHEPRRASLAVGETHRQYQMYHHRTHRPLEEPDPLADAPTLFPSRFKSCAVSPDYQALAHAYLLSPEHPPWDESDISIDQVLDTLLDEDSAPRPEGGPEYARLLRPGRNAPRATFSVQSAAPIRPDTLARLRRALSRGRPLGDLPYLRRVEELTGRTPWHGNPELRDAPTEHVRVIALPVVPKGATAMPQRSGAYSSSS